MAQFKQYCNDRRAGETKSTSLQLKTGRSTAPATVTRPMDFDSEDTDIEDETILAAVAQFEKEGKCHNTNVRAPSKSALCS